MDNRKVPPAKPMIDSSDIVEQDGRFAKRLVVFFGIILIAVLGFMSYVWITSGQMTPKETIVSLVSAFVVTALLAGGAAWVAGALD